MTDRLERNLNKILTTISILTACGTAIWFLSAKASAIDSVQSEMGALRADHKSDIMELRAADAEIRATFSELKETLGRIDENVKALKESQRDKR